MRKFTKSLLTLALLVLGVGGVNSVKADNATLTDLEAAHGSTSTWVSSIPALPVAVTNLTIFGSDANTEDTNANVNNYDYIYFEVTDFVEARAIRVFFWDPNASKRIDYYLKPVDDKLTADYSASSNVSAAGTYCVKIPDGARLQGAKAPWGSASTEAFKFSEIYLTERATPYVELIPYTLEWTPNAGTYRATIPISESHIRTTGNVSINYSTGEVTNTGSGTLVIYLNKEDLVGATGYNLTTAGGGLLGGHLDITDDVNGEVGGIYSSRNSWYIAGDASRKDKIGAVKAFTYVFDGGESAQTITSIYFDSNLLVAETTEKNLADMPYGRWGLPANKVSNYIEEDAFKTNNIGKGDQGLIYGHENVEDVYKYVDLTNCSKIIFTGLSSDGKLRLFYNWDGTEVGKSTATITDFPTSSDTYEFDIEAFKKSNSIDFFHLFGIKSSQWDTKANITDIKVVEYTNVISGSGIDRTKNYRLNPYITFIDATGVTAATTLEISNPNCLIKANAGKVTNSKNVIVDGVCENLVLTDGHPFKAAEDFTATAASYNTTINEEAEAGTLCLPFAATIPSGVKAWKLEYTSGSGDVATATEETGTIPANKPVLLNLLSGDGSVLFERSNVDIDADDGEPKVYGALTGVFAATAVPVGSYVLLNKNSELGFYKVKTDIPTAKPFRAYLTADSGAPSLNIIFPEDGNMTGISATLVNNEKVNSEIYNLKGQRISQPSKGLYIVNGKKYVVK